MTYQQALRYLESFINYEKISAWPYKHSLKLKRVGDFLSTIDNPQNNLRCLHVAGTKGKGSTCAFIAYILKQAGYKVGLYTSPHLVDFRERIRILRHKTKGSRHKLEKDFEGMISRNELVDLVIRLKPAIDKYNKVSKYGLLSFFEVYTALAFVYFKEKKTDFLVLETGLGGRLDATNMARPLVCVITPISYEHTQKLGSTLREIAAEKAGIIKDRRAIVISAPQETPARDVIRKRCKALGARLYEVGKDIITEEKNCGFGINGVFGKYPDLKVNLLGRHQTVNASVAVGAIAALRFHDITVRADSIRAGLYQAVWPGRCEVIAENPRMVLDGAQNVASARALKQAIRENFSCLNRPTGNKKYKKLILVFGISKDKDIKGTCRQLNGLADIVILTKSSNPRAQPPENLAGYFKDKPIYITQSVIEARESAVRIAAQDDLILVTGSLFIVGEFRDARL